MSKWVLVAQLHIIEHNRCSSAHITQRNSNVVDNQVERQEKKIVQAHIAILSL